MSHLVTSSDQTSWTVDLTVAVSVVEKPCRQRRSNGGEFTLKGCAAKEISGEDQTRWSRMSDLVSSEMLYTKKLRGKSASSLLVSGHGGDTFASISSWWTKWVMSETAFRRRSTRMGPLTEGFFPSWSKTLTRIFG